MRKNETLKKNNKRARDDEDLDVEAKYLVYSQGRHTLSTTLSDTDNARTGRWTTDEVAFVDHLVQCFDNGQLPVSHGVKLSSFLGDILLCRPSRLTKKMKNAKLSTRSFDFSLAQSDSTRRVSKEDCEVLSALQDRFIGSLQSKVAQLELKFNLVKQWRTYFSNLCVQIGYPHLDASDYISSLEEMERRASKVEDQMRVVRRKRMGLSTTSIMSNNTNATLIADSSADANLLVRMKRKRSFSEDLDNAIMSLYDTNSTTDSNLFDDHDGKPHIKKASRQTTTPGDPFLEAILKYMEESSLPFQHADVWVPSFVSSTEEQVQLLHAGHATRRDEGDGLLSLFSSFGEYSRSFIFRPNQGLPGRVYASGEPQWEFQLYDPSVFPRSKGAKACGLRTATGIPISTPGVGRMVVVFYSSGRIQEDSILINQCATELSSYSPAPRWKLVIEIGKTEKESSSSKRKQSSSSVMNNSQDINYDSEGSNEDDDSIRRIVSIMANETTSTAARNSESDASSSELLPHFMAIRLLMLKPPMQRSVEENDIIEILRSSFISYSQDGKRSDKELAQLLAREWLCLSSEKTLSQVTDFDSESSFYPPLSYSSHQLSSTVSCLPPLVNSAIAGPPMQLSRPELLGSSNSALRRTVSCTGIQSDAFQDLSKHT